MRMLAGTAGLRPPAVQRGPGTTAALSVIISKQMVDEAISQNEALLAIQREIHELTPGDEAEDKAMGRRGGEETGDRRDKLVTALGSLRSRLAVEAVAEKLGGNEGLAKAIRRRFNLQMARITPFYTQWWNANILGTKKHPARLRTCNVSTIGMVLEALGKTAADFNGSHELMDAIAGTLEEKTPAVDLRFPDFLQILAIYLQMPGNKRALASMAGTDPAGFKTRMDAASDAAHGAILDSSNFNAFTSKFGVSVENVDPDLQKGLAVIGGYYRPMEKDFEKFLSDKGKAGAKGKEKRKLHEEFIKGRKAGYRWRGKQAGKRAAEHQAVSKCKPG